MNTVQGLPDVTVVTVVFNAVKCGRGEAFRRCIESVQMQRGVQIEHVIIDGASRDGTIDIVRDFSEARWPIRLFSEPDSGIYEAMNRGLARAEGCYVAYLNSDDFYHSVDGLAESVMALEKTKADFSYAPACVVDGDGHEVGHPFREACPYLVYQGMTICHQSMLVRKTVLERLGGFDLRYRSAADYDLLFRMTFAGLRACRVPKLFVTFQTGGFSERNAALVDREVAQIYKELFNRYVAAGLTDASALALRKATEFPAGLSQRLAAFGRKTFGEDFHPGSEMLAWWKPGCDYAVVRAAAERLRGEGFLCFLIREPALALRFMKGRLVACLRRNADSFDAAFQDACETLVRERGGTCSPADVICFQPDAWVVRDGLALVRDLSFSMDVPISLGEKRLSLIVLTHRDGNSSVREEVREIDAAELSVGRIKVLASAREPNGAPVVFVGAYLSVKSEMHGSMKLSSCER